MSTPIDGETNGRGFRMPRRFRQSVEQMRRYAKNADTRAHDVYERSHQATAGIPMGQPILLGHHSQRGHEKAIERSHALMDKAIEAQDRASYWTRKADHAERYENAVDEALAHNVEGLQIGDECIARFTNSGNILTFPGVIVGRTTQDWKVRAAVGVWPGEEPGRVFKIAAAGSRKYSANNCVRKA